MGILSKILGAVATPFLGPLGPALIGAGSSLLGGALSNQAERKGIAAQNAYNDPAQIRARAEAAGFNPLLFVGPGVGNQTTAASGGYMGAAIADAGMQIADQMAKNRELGRLEKLAAENKKLAEKVQNLTIRPKVGGVYAQREAYNENRSGNNSVVSPAGGAALSYGDDVTPLSDTLPVDPRRKVDNKAIGTQAGLMVVDQPNLNALLGGPMYIPSLDGDEALQWYDYPSVILPMIGSAMYNNWPTAPAPKPRPKAWTKPSNVGRVIPRSYGEIPTLGRVIGRDKPAGRTVYP